MTTPLHTPPCRGPYSTRGWPMPDPLTPDTTPALCTLCSTPSPFPDTTPDATARYHGWAMHPSPVCAICLHLTTQDARSPLWDGTWHGWDAYHAGKLRRLGPKYTRNVVGDGITRPRRSGATKAWAYVRAWYHGYTVAYRHAQAHDPTTPDPDPAPLAPCAQSDSTMLAAYAARRFTRR